ncbi:hypothetical protein [Lewinella sp. 4G2]|uniref:hypothetical protein n=1 Tax=Lewinella sp. 4G2 TaxID=1803372 RepID=UPI0007B49E2C|nr:hypothetical protein [Lewinella sp. 4G2]OAV43707.1 hypothetical protein A3850_003975 [Lewinella sp. 4G2]
MKSLLTLLLLIITISLTAQTTFPNKWVGDYDGTMIIGNAGQANATVPVTFTLEELIADSVYIHRMVFNSEQYGVITKDYQLVAQTAGDTTHFILDERNGITMDQTLMNDCFYGMYTVMGSTYISTLRRLPDDTLLWDLFAAKSDTERVTELEGKEPIKVVGLTVGLHQTVYLKKRF